MFFCKKATVFAPDEV
jgi:hypothetical protein